MRRRRTVFFISRGESVAGGEPRAMGAVKAPLIRIFFHRANETFNVIDVNTCKPHPPLRHTLSLYHPPMPPFTFSRPNPRARPVPAETPSALRDRSFRRSARCRIVGRPCGQFHGACSSLTLSSTRRMVFASSALPIMMLERHARMASIARTRVGRTI